MSSGENAAQSLTEKVKGAANLAHGSGESIRGNINSFVDNLGNQAQDQSGSSGTHAGVGHSGTVGKDAENELKNHATAAQGKEEMQAGMKALERK